VKGDPAVCPRERKHHDETGGASVEAIGRNDQGWPDEILLMAARWAEIDRPDFTA